MKKRAVITGIGLLTPLGNEPCVFLRNILDGRCGLGPIRKFDPAAFPVRIGGEIDLSQEASLPAADTDEMTTVAKWSVLAARKAVLDAGLNIEKEDPFGIDVVLGVSTSSMESLREEYFADNGNGFARATHKTAFLASPNNASLQVVRDLGLFGEATNITTACSSSATAIGYAARSIQYGDATCVITGGADEAVSKLFLGSFGAACLSKRNEDPKHSCRPFDRGRDGIVLSDAACILILEEYERAKKRGARMYCEVTGFAGGGDGGSVFRLARSEEPSVRVMQLALQRAHLEPADIDYCNSAAPGDPVYDVRETVAFKKVFGGRSKCPPITSIKGMLGHPQGAAGAVQTAVSAFAIREHAVPPTINLDDPDPDCDLDYIPNVARSLRVRNALVFSHGNARNDVLLLSAV